MAVFSTVTEELDALVSFSSHFPGNFMANSGFAATSFKLCYSSVKKSNGFDLQSSLCVDQAHKQIAYICTIFCFVEKRILPMQDGLLKNSFTDIAIKQCLGKAQKNGKPSPVPKLLDLCPLII